MSCSPRKEGRPSANGSSSSGIISISSISISRTGPLVFGLSRGSAQDRLSPLFFFCKRTIKGFRGWMLSVTSGPSVFPPSTMMYAEPPEAAPLNQVEPPSAVREESPEGDALRVQTAHREQREQQEKEPPQPAPRAVSGEWQPLLLFQHDTRHLDKQGGELPPPSRSASGTFAQIQRPGVPREVAAA
ncbi:hypothetical protein Esti_001097 [Eimeria stiedai]